MTAAGITWCDLRGTRVHKDEAIAKFRAGTVAVMLATAAKDCAGLDLPFVTRVVLYHGVLDRNVEAQVVARGQRLGRAHNLEIVKLLYESEVNNKA